MLEQYIPKRFANAMLKHIIAVTLFFPYFYSKNERPFYQDFVLANFFAVLAIVFICTSWKLDFKRNAIFVTGLGLLLVAYNVCATYMNVKYHHWYGEQINTTISFLLFIVLLLVKDTHALIDTSTIKATIHMIVASNVLAILFRVFTGYNQLRFMNDRVDLTVYEQSIEDQFAWLYGHKSEYGLLLVLCVAFVVRYRKYFRNISTYVLSLGVLFVALYISDSYTAMGAAMLILVGQFLDYLCKAKWWKKLVIAIPLFVLLIIFIHKYVVFTLANRDITTLGGRIYIWSSFIKYIQENPNGVTDTFGSNQYLVIALDNIHNYRFYTNNCHNVFLNHIFRYSIPVGCIFSTLFILVTMITIKRQISFANICIWIAIYIPLTMDYSLTIIELPFILLLIMILFYCNSTPYKNNSQKT